MTNRTSWVFALALVASVTPGCAERLGGTRSDAGVADTGPWTGGDLPPTSGNFTHAVENGVVTTLVNATSAASWHHLDLDTGHSVELEEGWELSFSRFRVRINGGVSGSGGVRVAPLDGQGFDTLTQAPEDGWTVPVPDGEVDDDDEPDNVFNNGETDWYLYDEETHTLTPRETTYAVASTEGRFYKLAFEAYYDDAGSPAWVRFRWAAIAPPASALPDAGPGGVPDAGVRPDAGPYVPPVGAIVVNAGDGASWVYVSATDGVVTPTDPSTSTDWDIAFRRTAVRTNSGTSGPGVGGARIDESGDAFDEITRATTLGYVADEIIDSGVPGSTPTSLNAVLIDWYDYSPTTHSVTPSDLSFLLRTATGGYAKLRIHRWNDGEYVLTLAPVTRHVEIVELDVDATATDAWTYLDLHAGALAEVTDAATDARWDVGFSGTHLRTNGGTSGAGEGAAVETTAASLATFTEVPTAGWLIDEMIDEGAPSGGEYSGNPALAAWYDVSPASPRPVAFAIRTSDGQYGAMRVLSFASGVYRVELAFFGPEHTGFGD